MSEPTALQRWQVDAAVLNALHLALDRMWVDHADVEDGDRMAFTLSVAELAANVVEHADAQEIWFGFVVDDDAIVAVLLDDGLPTPRRVDSQMVSDDPLVESGRGMALARQLTALSYRREDDRNRWQVTRTRGG